MNAGPRTDAQPSPTPPTLKTTRGDVRDEDKNRAGRGPPETRGHHVTTAGSAVPERRHAPAKPKNTMSADAGCCDASPWMSWNWWWEPIRGYTRQRSQAEQEMIEACTTPRSGRTSFDE